ncbi:MAG: hypothetical protein QXP01_06620 [Candidatus Hadarchaeum sp.]
MTVEEIITRLDHFSTKELEKLAQEIRVILDARDENYVASFQRKRRRPLDPLYWAAKILLARDKQREIERKMMVEQCVDEMVCKLCGHELDCFCGCQCLCHELV